MEYLGEGRFGTCFLKLFCHFKIRLKELENVIAMLLLMKPTYYQNFIILIYPICLEYAR